MEVAFYNKRRDTVYIYADAIKPAGLEKMSWRERFALEDKVFSMPYEERIQKYATKEQARQIQELFDRHPGCSISEYC